MLSVFGLRKDGYGTRYRHGVYIVGYQCACNVRWCVKRDCIGVCGLQFVCEIEIRIARSEIVRVENRNLGERNFSFIFNDPGCRND